MTNKNQKSKRNVTKIRNKTKTKERDKETIKKINEDIKVFDKLTKKEKDLLEKKQVVTEITEKKRWFPKWSSRYKLKKYEDSSYVITMMFNNGTQRHIIITTTEETFVYKGKMYIILHDESTFDLSLRQYHLYYNEDVGVPINREIAYIQDDNCDPGKEEAYFSVTPSNMKHVLKMEYVRALASSVELNKYLRMILIFSVFSFMATIINLGLFYYKFGR